MCIDFVAEHLFILDQHGDIDSFNMRANPAVKTNSCTFSEELGKFVNLQ